MSKSYSGGAESSSITPKSSNKLIESGSLPLSNVSDSGTSAKNKLSLTNSSVPNIPSGNPTHSTKPIDIGDDVSPAAIEKRIQRDITLLLRDFYRQHRGPGTPYYRHHAHSRFTVFSKLPIEIRLKIWKMALPGPKFIKMDLQSSPLGQDGYIWLPRCSEKNPALLSTCNESRAMALKHYHSVGRRPQGWVKFVDFSTDILCYTWLGSWIQKASLINVIPEHGTSLSSLAIARDVWYRWKNRVEELPKLIGLKELMIAQEEMRYDEIIGFEVLGKEEWDTSFFPGVQLNYSPFDRTVTSVENAFQQIKTKNAAWTPPTLRLGTFQLKVPTSSAQPRINLRFPPSP